MSTHFTYFFEKLKREKRGVKEELKREKRGVKEELKREKRGVRNARIYNST
jgi:hypothetical protein